MSADVALAIAMEPASSCFCLSPRCDSSKERRRSTSELSTRRWPKKKPVKPQQPFEESSPQLRSEALSCPKDEGPHASLLVKCYSRPPTPSHAPWLSTSACWGTSFSAWAMASRGAASSLALRPCPVRWRSWRLFLLLPRSHVRLSQAARCANRSETWAASIPPCSCWIQ